MDEPTIHAERAREWGGEAGMDRAVAERRPEAREATDRLLMGAESIHMVISHLEERLHDLLGPERPQGIDKHGDEARMTDFGGRLHGVADQFVAAERRLADLLDRLRDGF